MTIPIGPVRACTASRGAAALRPIVLLLLVLATALAFAQVPVPALTAPVMDQTQTLTPAQIASLDRTIRDFRARKGSQISVLIVPTTQPESIEQYSIRVVDDWKLGRRDVEDGVLLLVAKDDRTVRIEVGYGLEGALPDVIANRIVQQVIVPRFREGDFAGGLAEGIERIVAVIEGEPLPEPQRQSQPSVEGIGQVFPVLLMLVFVGGGILRRMLGGFGGATVVGGVAGTIAWALTKVIGIGIGAGVLAFVFTLLGGGGFGGSGWSNRRRGGGYGGGWGGGFGGGGGGSFGGGGGWSGGGGGFGGGGASGRW